MGTRARTSDGEPADARGASRERILDAAVRRIASEGIDGVRVARIAMDAGVSAALVHYHFASRDALLVEALEHSFERAGDVRIGEGDPRASGSVAARLAGMVDACLPVDGVLRDDFLLWAELWLRAARQPELQPVATRLYARLHAWMGDAVAEGLASGELRCAAPREAVDRLLALIDGYGTRVLIGDAAMPAERARREIWHAVASELGLDPAARLAGAG